MVASLFESAVSCVCILATERYLIVTHFCIGRGGCCKTGDLEGVWVLDGGGVVSGEEEHDGSSVSRALSCSKADGVRVIGRFECGGRGIIWKGSDSCGSRLRGLGSSRAGSIGSGSR